MRRTLLVVLLLSVTSVVAQQKVATGTVTGHISCSDTNLPARLATIKLWPVPAGLTKATADEGHSLNATSGLDGSYVIHGLSAGTYYVIVQYPGYLSSDNQFTRTEIGDPTPEVRERLAKSIRTITVTPDKAANLDFRLSRAGSISGTIRYDDGSPAPRLVLHFERRDITGGWISSVMIGFGSYAVTDDLGRFRLDGLSAGEYRLETTLGIIGQRGSTTVGSVTDGSIREVQLWIPMYFGNVFQKEESKLLELGDGQERSGVDFVIPVSKLHSVTGSLVDARTGAVINSGSVELFIAGHERWTYGITIDYHEPTFHFDFIPEGQYTIRVPDARDINREVVPGDDSRRGTAIQEIVVRTYAPYEAPFIVQKDMIGITLPLTPKETKAE